MDDKMTPAGVAMMQSLVNMVGCDCPKEENSDYRNEEGLLVCGVCGKRKERKLNVPYLGERIVPTLCACGEEKIRREEEEKVRREEQKRCDDLFSFSLIDDRFKESTFDNFQINEYNQRQFKLAKRYVEKFEEMYARNKGLLFYGEPSTGKTYLASCIANALLKKRVPLIVTSIIKLTSASGPFSKEAEEQRRVAEGGQGAADVGDKENEEDDDVHTVLAVLIGPEQGPDEQHGRAGGSHPAGEDGPEGEQPGVHHRRAHELTFEADATRDCEQCEQQDDERDVFHEEDMDKLIDSQLESEDHGAGHEEGEAPEEGHLAEMVMPEMRHGKGADGDGQQHANKGNNPQDGQFRSVEVVTAGSLGRQGYQRRQRQRHKHGKQSFHLGSAPWENFFYQTFL